MTVKREKVYKRREKVLRYEVRRTGPGSLHGTGVTSITEACALAAYMLREGVNEVVIAKRS